MTNLEILTTIEALFSANPVVANLPLKGLQQIALQEGCETEAYQDTTGNWTIGIGHKGAYAGEVWTVDQCFRQFFKDVVEIAVDPLNVALPWARQTMGEVRWWVFVNMTYNMGIAGFMAFSATIQAAHLGDWEGTARGMEESLWYTQVGQRGVELCQQMRTNQWVLPDA
ncbi:MAG: glycoside hydrolase family protein [Acidithiobacillus sp.]|uniref:glycoside hydrolase family protein n=1 Tax=Acidithiobacillus sp. TaxID=1872118 RepID=UPI003D029077